MTKSVCTTVFTALACSALVLLVPMAQFAQAQENVLYSFAGGTDGNTPKAGLIDMKGVLYGTTYSGGAHSEGTVFALDPNTGAERILYSFCSRQDCSDGAYPAAGLTNVNGILYGTTLSGGLTCKDGGCGTLYEIDPKTGVETVIHSFCSQKNCKDGEYPYSGVIGVKGILYGTTKNGGGNYAGTVFSFDPETGKEKVLYSFCGTELCPDGRLPEAGLIYVKGALYGTTFEGGNTGCFSEGCGTVFALDPRTGAETVLYTFCSVGNCTDGELPLAALVDVKGTLYGTTSWGGTSRTCNAGCGTVFALNPDTNAMSVIYSFCTQSRCADGLEPLAGLINVKGILYGTTYNGGTSQNCFLGCGAAFSFDPDTGSEQVLYSFCSAQNCTDGENPWAGLIHTVGTVYGTTSAGGADGEGTVFALGIP